MVRLASAVLAFTFLARLALATDGVLEINQACAASATGCFPGDAAGLPVTITQSGSYRLTGDLTVPNLNTTAIDVESDDVSIDLKGFAIRGPNQCVPGNCNSVGGGSSVGRDFVLIPRQRISVRNGLIVGVGGNGIAVSGEAHVEGAKAAFGTVGPCRPSSEFRHTTRRRSSAASRDGRTSRS